MSDDFDPRKSSKKPKLFVVKDEEDLLLDLEDTDDGGEGGDSKGGGTTGPLIDPALFGLENTYFLELIREAERRFSNGWVPITKEPRKPGQPGYNEGPPPHPLLSQSQQFSGDDPKITADPAQNENAAEKYPELRPNLQPTPQPQHVAQPGATIPRPSPLGR